MSDPQQMNIKLEREDTPTRSIWQRYKYELLVRHAKLFWGTIISIIFFFIIGFPFVIFVMKMHWGFGFVGIFILLYWVLKWVFLAIWFVVSRAGLALLFAPLIYLIIKYFIHVDKVGFRELGSKHTYFFKVTTTSDGYLLHEKRFFGNKPIYLDKVTVQYFKENGSERVFKEKGKEDKDFLELDIVPLSWRNDSLYITDIETKKCFLNQAILVTEPIRDYYTMIIKGLPPTQQEVEKNVIYETILGTADIKQQLLQAKYQLRNVVIERLEMVLDVALPHKGEEFLRIKRVTDKKTEPYDGVVEIEGQKSLLKELSQAKSKEELDAVMMYYVSEEEN
jgi:tetrahydromethanopterin S-methyltransferase subunit F